MSEEQSTAVATVDPPKTKSTALVKPQQSKVTVGDVALTPDQIIGAALASGYYKHIKTKADGYIIAAYGAAMGMDLTTALSSIILVNGRMTLSANLVAARIKQSGKYRYRIVEKTAEKCSIEFLEKVEYSDKKGAVWWEWEKQGVETFTVKMAERAQLTTKGPNWKAYPEAMCFARAITAGARTYTPELFMGRSVYTPDELDPTMPMTMNSEGELVPDAEYTVAPVVSKADQSEEFNAKVDEVKALIAKTNTDQTPFLNYFSVASVGELSLSQLDKAISLLNAKLSALPKA